MATVERAPARRAPVQERSRRRVEAILDATERLVVERGVEALSTREIAVAAGVPVASLYQWFADKEGVLLALVERDTAEMDEQVAADLATLVETGDLTLAGLVETAMRAFVSVYARRRAFVEIYLRGRTNTAVHAYGREHNVRIARALRELALASGVAGPDLSEQVAVLAVEVGDRVFQLAYERDDHGDQALVAEGIVMVTAYLERYAAARPAAVSARDDVAAAARRLAAEGLLVGTAGNVSVRVRDLVAVTASGVVLADCRPHDVVLVDHDGTLVDGGLVPTSEIDLHLGVYADQPGVGAVVHTHAPWSTAVACVLDELPVLHYQQLLLGGAVRVAPYATFGSPELAPAVRDGARRAPGRADGQPRLGRRRHEPRPGRRARAAARVAGRPAPPRLGARHAPRADRRGAGGRRPGGPVPQLRIHPGGVT